MYKVKEKTENSVLNAPLLEKKSKNPIFLSSRGDKLNRKKNANNSRNLHLSTEHLPLPCDELEKGKGKEVCVLIGNFHLVMHE